MMSLFFFALINLNTATYLIVANLILSGIGFGLFASPNNNVIMGSVEKRFYGMPSSTLASMRLIGMSISMALTTLILDNYVGTVQLSVIRSIFRSAFNRNQNSFLRIYFGLPSWSDSHLAEGKTR